VAGDGDGLTVPTSAGGGHEFSRMRLDYAFASPEVAERVRAMRVVRGDETEYASDHYPITVDLAR
jgi:exodeoxyribonuclease-3